MGSLCWGELSSDAGKKSCDSVHTGLGKVHAMSGAGGREGPVTAGGSY